MDFLQSTVLGTVWDVSFWENGFKKKYGFGISEQLQRPSKRLFHFFELYSQRKLLNY